MTSSSSSAPIVCDMTNAPDSPEERRAEYGRLFEHALVGRESTADAVVWQFTNLAGVEAWVRDLADREAACCPFLTYAVTTQGGQVIWRVGADDDPIKQAILDEFHDLPERVRAGLPVPRGGASVGSGLAWADGSRSRPGLA